MRSEKHIPTKASKRGRAEIRVGKDGGIRLIGIALRRIKQRCGGKSRRIEISVDAFGNLARGQGTGQSAAGSQLSAESSGGKAQTQECATSPGIGNGKWCARLENRDSADRPSTKECTP